MRKVLYIICGLGGIIALSGVMLLVFSPTESVGEKVSPSDVQYSLGDTKTVNPCVDDANCLYSDIVSYDFMSYHSGITVLDNKISKINADTEKYYQEALSSTVEDPSCAMTYKNSVQTQSDYTVYSGQEYFSIAVLRGKIHLCTRETEAILPKSYIYSVKEGRLVSQEELLDLLGLRKKDIYQTVADSIESLTENLDASNLALDIDFDKMVLYFDKDGKLIVAYPWIDGSNYYTAIVDY